MTLLSSIGVTKIWYLLAIVFLIPALFHLFISFQNINTIKMPYIPNYSIMTYKDSRGEFDISKSYKDAIDEINTQITTQNSQSATINRISFFGYLLTSLTCFLSGYIPDKKKRKAKKQKGTKRIKNST